jgi:EAL and modified HD-GYP domain-containing signal transduction protein
VSDGTGGGERAPWRGAETRRPGAVGRQPIFDRRRQVYAYELLFRAAADAEEACFFDGDGATSQVILNSFVSIGIDDVAGELPVFINMTRSFLVDGLASQLPADRVVLEILEDLEVDEELVSAVRALREQGYRIALDDFVYHPSKEPLLDLCEVVKVDLRLLDAAELNEHARLLRGRVPTLLAEKVETEQEYRLCREAGFDLFQGYFFAKPKVLGGRRMRSNKLAALQLLTKLRDPRTPLAEIERLVGHDVSLSYKLLRVVNSAAMAMARKVESVRRAVLMLGRQRITAWVSLIAFAELGMGERELMRTAMVRGRMCENLASVLGHGGEADSFFTVGLFSALEALLGQPMAEILAPLPLAEPLVQALLQREGAMGDALVCTLAYERGDEQQLAARSAQAKLALPVLRDAYLGAVRWADEASRAFEQPED